MNPTIVLLPGLGADQRLFASLCSMVPGISVPLWPALEPGDSITTFAKRLVSSIPRGDNIYLGGSSFGGMVALELAASVRPKGLFLIGSCTNPASIPSVLRLLGTILSILPAPLFRPRHWMLPFVASRFGALNAQDKELLWSMAAGMPPAFLKWGIRALLSWQPTPVAAPIHHIHGSDDRIIPINLVHPDRSVPGGGHLLALTHPEEVAAFLSETISGHVLR
jgi:pimeloyl-ACP methyl ester carboxylesterase